jgi:Mnd1 HTH domain
VIVDWLTSTDFAFQLLSHTEGFVCFVVSQTVKEVLQSLVDDNLVQMDKIGSSNCRCSRLVLPPSTPVRHIQTHAGSLLELPFSEGCDRKFLFIVIRGILIS